MGMLKTLLGLGLLTSLLKHLKFAVRLDPNQRCLLLRGKKIIRVLHPGWNWYVPIVYHHTEKLNVTQKTKVLERQEIPFAGDNIICTVHGILLFEIDNVIHAEMNVDNLMVSLIERAETVLFNELRDHSYFELPSTKELSATLKTTLQEEVENWGVKVNDFRLKGLKPSDSSEAAITRCATVSQGVKALNESLADLKKVADPVIAAALLNPGTSVVAQARQAAAHSNGHNGHNGHEDATTELLETVLVGGGNGNGHNGHGNGHGL